MKKIFVLLGLVMFLSISCAKKEQEPEVANVNFTPCRQTKTKSAELSGEVNVEFTNEGVIVTHFDFEVTCDFTAVDVTHTFVNGVLRITQQSSPSQADCICYTDVLYTINGISQSEVNVIFVNGKQVYCHSDNDDEDAVRLLESIIVSQNNNYWKKCEYEYDSQNRITRGTRYFLNYFRLHYNTDGDLVAYSSTDGVDKFDIKATLSQNDNKISFSISEHPDINEWVDVNGELELNAQGFPVKLESTYIYIFYGSCGLGVRDSTYTTIAFEWQNGNLIKEDRKREYVNIRYGYSFDDDYDDCIYEGVIDRQEGSSITTRTFTYDDKKTPFHFCNTPKWVLWWLNYSESVKFFRSNIMYYEYNENNVQTETSEDGSSKIYEYVYNDDGLPVTRTWATSAGEITETYTYKEK